MSRLALYEQINPSHKAEDRAQEAKQIAAGDGGSRNFLSRVQWATTFRAGRCKPTYLSPTIGTKRQYADLWCSGWRRRWRIPRVWLRNLEKHRLLAMWAGMGLVQVLVIDFHRTVARRAIDCDGHTVATMAGLWQDGSGDSSFEKAAKQPPGVNRNKATGRNCSQRTHNVRTRSQFQARVQPADTLPGSNALGRARCLSPPRRTASAVGGARCRGAGAALARVNHQSVIEPACCN